MSYTRTKLENMIRGAAGSDRDAQEMLRLLGNLLARQEEAEQPAGPVFRVRLGIELEVSETTWRQRYALRARGVDDTAGHVRAYFADLVGDAVPVREGSARVVDVSSDWQ